jgi:hypothetical protein
MQPYPFNDFKKRSVIFVFKSAPPKRSGLDCDVIVKTVNAHLRGDPGRSTSQQSGARAF